jgi:DNA modification methylase
MIRHCDCRDGLRDLADESIDLVITSPPYADLKTYGDDGGIPADKYVEWFMPIVMEVFRVLKPTGSFLLNLNDKVEGGFRHPYVFHLISAIHSQTKFKMFERLVWNKMKGLPNARRFGDRIEFVFWFVKGKGFTFNLDEMRVPYSEVSLNRMKNPIKARFSRTLADEEGYKDWSPHPKGALPTTLVSISSEVKRIADTHLAVFPVALVEYFIKGATKEGDLVLDIFAGTGTTGVACATLNRRFLGMEKQKDYVEIATRRISSASTDPPHLRPNVSTATKSTH